MQGGQRSANGKESACDLGHKGGPPRIASRRRFLSKDLREKWKVTKKKVVTEMSGVVSRVGENVRTEGIRDQGQYGAPPSGERVAPRVHEASKQGGDGCHHQPRVSEQAIALVCWARQEQSPSGNRSLEILGRATGGAPPGGDPNITSWGVIALSARSGRIRNAVRCSWTGGRAWLGLSGSREFAFGASSARG